MQNNITVSIDIWLNALEQYDFSQIRAKPTPTSWSLGQVCMHLVNETNYYLGQIKVCVTTNDNSNEEATPIGKMMLLNNEFPDEIIEGPPSNFFTPQSDSKEDLVNKLVNLKDEISKAARLISESSFKGKTKHPGLNYFNASEWYQFAHMHFRHHLRQKKRIEDFLKIGE
jgi:hypothetical protein